MRLKEMSKGLNTVPALIKDIEIKEARNGNIFSIVIIADKDIEDLHAQMWEDLSEKKEELVGKIKNLVVEVGSYQERPAYTIKNILDFEGEPVLSDYLKTAPRMGDEIYNEIMEMIKSMENDSVKKIVGNLIALNKDKFLYAGAAKKLHHATIGGLAWHSYRMAKSAIAIAPLYHVDKDILVGGCLIHDIGKLDELSTDSLGIIDYTTDGNLIGHAVLGAKMVMEMGEKCKKRSDISDEVVRLLSHIVLSHHGKPEYGAAVQPMTPEAEIIHELDMIDSRMYQYEEVQSNLEAGEFSDRQFGLGNIPVYKPVV